MLFTNLKYITAEDFPQDKQDIARGFGSIWNPFIDQFKQFVNKGVDYANLAQELRTVTFTTGTNGQPLGGLTFKSSLRNNITGLVPLSVQLPNNPQGYVTQAPFFNFTQDSGMITIPYIAGLQNETKYTIVLLII